MLSLKTLISEKKISYDGTQLAPHWIYRNFGILGDAVVAFQGPADVSVDHMVDLEDVTANAPIKSPLMLHFLGEWFQDSFEAGILLQHYMTLVVEEALYRRNVPEISRRGNDLFVGGKKLSVSIATRSPVSTLFHMGINIETEGTPIPTSGLRPLDIEPVAFAREILGRLAEDSEGWKRARCKVLPRA